MLRRKKAWEARKVLKHITHRAPFFLKPTHFTLPPFLFFAFLFHFYTVTFIIYNFSRCIYFVEHRQIIDFDDFFLFFLNFFIRFFKLPFQKMISPLIPTT